MLKAVPQKRLFPLHLAPIDDFFLLEDRPEYPMTFASNLFFTGCFDRIAFQDALNDALLLHPLLHAMIQPAKQGKPCWVAAKERPTAVDWGDWDTPIDVEQRARIDLGKETGLRIWIRQDEAQQRSRMVIQFHHACSDGTGAHRFIGDLLAGYGIRTIPSEAKSPTLADYNPQLLKSRNRKLADEYVQGGFLTNLRRGMGQAIRIFGKRITPLALTPTQTSAQVEPVALPGVVSFSFSKEEHKQLREAASRHGAMLNDLLLAEVFQAMRTWNAKRGKSSHQRLRVMMPSDLRGKEDFAMPAANMTSYNFITRHTRDCADAEVLIKSIRNETARIKAEGLGRQFVDGIMAARKVPGLLPYLTSSRRCMSTICVSHMGDPTRRFLATFPRKNGKILCGNVVLDNMVGVSPLRPLTRAALSIVTLYRQLTLNLRCDPQTMSLNDSQGLLDTYVERLKSHL